MYIICAFGTNTIYTMNTLHIDEEYCATINKIVPLGEIFDLEMINMDHLAQKSATVYTKNANGSSIVIGLDKATEKELLSMITLGFTPPLNTIFGISEQHGTCSFYTKNYTNLPWNG